MDNWLRIAPPEDLAGEDLLLQRPRPQHLPSLTAAVQDSITELHQFMPWATLDYGLEEATAFVDRAQTTWRDGSDFPYVIVLPDQPDAVVGSAGLINRVGAGVLEIGYWVATPHTGRRIARRAAAMLIAAARALPGVHAVEIHHDQANLASRSVPTALGFRLVEVRDHTDVAPGTTGRLVVWSLAL